jgi:GxxExxY protein
MPLEFDPHVEAVIGSALDVHRQLGPGLLESAYQRCLAHSLARTGHHVAQQVPLAIIFDGCHVDCGYRVDMIVDDAVLVELKSVEHLLPIHGAQVLTYLKLAGLRHGLLINFNVALLKTGLRSFLNPQARAQQVAKPARPAD